MFGLFRNGSLTPRNHVSHRQTPPGIAPFHNSHRDTVGLDNIAELVALDLVNLPTDARLGRGLVDKWVRISVHNTM